MNKNNLKNKVFDITSKKDNDNSGFILQMISAVLLIICISTLLLFNNKKIRIITDNINIDGFKKTSDIESEITNNNNSSSRKNNILLKDKNLNVKAKHSNVIVGRLTQISFTEENTTVEMAVTNGSLYNIHLNLKGKGIVLVDDLGNKYDVKEPMYNPSLEIESGETFKGELVFQGGVTSKASNLILITNNQIGSDQPLSRRPKMKFYIPLS